MAREPVTFTKAQLLKLQPEARRYEVQDAEQRKLILRVYPTGNKVFFMLKRTAGGRAGTMSRLKIGPFPEVSVKTARDRVGSWLNAIAAGHDPWEERRETRAKGRTVGELWSEYLQEAKKRKRSWKNDEWQYDKHVKAWKARQLSSVTQTDVARLKARVHKSGGPVAANRVLALLSSMWSWSQDPERRSEWGILQNPCRSVERYEEVARERYLLPAELREFVEATNADESADIRDAVLLLLLTGQRKANICGLRWSEVEFRDEALRIPAERMKADRDHLVPLAPAALEVLKERRSRAEAGAEFVFPSTRKAGHLYDIRDDLERIKVRAGIGGRLTPHDLRRTFATYAREIGRDPGPVLAHKPAGITEKVYAQPTFKGMRDTVRATVNHMLTIATATEAKVVDFPGAAR